jgi:hypothetical protein
MNCATAHGRKVDMPANSNIVRISISMPLETFEQIRHEAHNKRMSKSAYIAEKLSQPQQVAPVGAVTHQAVSTHQAVVRESVVSTPVNTLDNTPAVSKSVTSRQSTIEKPVMQGMGKYPIPPLKDRKPILSPSNQTPVSKGQRGKITFKSYDAALDFVEEHWDDASRDFQDFVWNNSGRYDTAEEIVLAFNSGE